VKIASMSLPSTDWAASTVSATTCSAAAVLM
jgi:hypothetical protein